MTRREYDQKHQRCEALELARDSLNAIYDDYGREIEDACDNLIDTQDYVGAEFVANVGQIKTAMREAFDTAVYALEDELAILNSELDEAEMYSYGDGYGMEYAL